MAKTSAKAKNNKRIKLVEKFQDLRTELKKRQRSEDPEVAMEAMEQLAKRRRDESPIRVRNRCNECGRPHGTYRRFGLCRICLRQAVMRGDVPGARKASW